jgi:hypothetical protein
MRYGYADRSGDGPVRSRFVYSDGLRGRLFKHPDARLIILIGLGSPVV